MNTVAIIDYGMCNLDSVARAIEECGGSPLVTDQAKDIEQANRIILPGVGAFPDAMRNIKQRGLDEILPEQVIGKQIPFLGICLGMQLLATKGWEVEETAGLGWIEGEVRRLQSLDQETRIPHIGWNEVNFTHDSPLFRNIPASKDFYFVHSYHVCCANEAEVLARTPYCGEFISGVERGWIFGVQFHPEKSQRLGFQVLKNFLSL
ncbi:MAG: imidazole glycerol phosphate synthase subunit HisH 1 [Chloroflexota bacterium]|nr:MAG: imidazole glycerol phosphate synthase subunit HisH 1 [Chloroflexota bacterium]